MSEISSLATKRRRVELSDSDERKILGNEPTNEWRQLMKLAEQGDKEAEFKVALAYENGNGIVSCNLSTALEWYLKAAQHGHVQSIGRYGKLNLQCGGYGGRYAEMIRYASDRGDRDSKCLLATLHWIGDCAVLDEKKAIKLLKECALLGHEVSKVMICGMDGEHFRLDDLLVETDGLQTYEAMEILGACYRGGEFPRFIPANEKKSIEWFEKAVAHGSRTCIHDLYKFYMKQRKRDKAIDWLLQGVSKGNLNCMFELATNHSRGRYGFSRDKFIAIKWYTAAADRGHHDSMVALAAKYEHGSGTAQNLVKAFDLYTRAAHCGNDIAMYRLSRMYGDGRGCVQNHERQITWLIQAFLRGNYQGAYDDLVSFYAMGIRSVLHDIKELQDAVNT